MKYIVIACNTNGRASTNEFPIIFPAELTHRTVAHWVKRAIEAEFRSPVDVVAAGFINHFDGKANGYSETLGLKARPEDQALIDKYVPRAPRLEAT